MTAAVWVAIVAICVTLIVTLVTALINFAHRQGKVEGQQDTRIESLEAWRSRVRDDMHEISDKLESIAVEVNQVRILIDERTERRVVNTRYVPPDHRASRRKEDKE